MRLFLRPFVLALFVSLMLCGNGMATRVGFKEVTCKICGTKFESVILYSFMLWGEGLDFIRDIPNTLSQCPGCNCIYLADNCDTDGVELTPERFKKLKEYILSSEYRSLPPETSKQLRLAKMMEVLDVPPSSLAWLYLRAASYEEKGELTYNSTRRDFVKNPDTVDALLRTCLRYLERYDPGTKGNLEDRLESAYLKVEVNRRLGRFSEAEKWAASVREQLERAKKLVHMFNERNAKLVKKIDDYLKQQEELIKAGVNRPKWGYHINPDLN